MNLGDTFILLYVHSPRLSFSAHNAHSTSDSCYCNSFLKVLFDNIPNLKLLLVLEYIISILIFPFLATASNSCILNLTSLIV